MMGSIEGHCNLRTTHLDEVGFFFPWLYLHETYVAAHATDPCYTELDGNQVTAS